jgi:hypothetical protein
VGDNVVLQPAKKGKVGNPVGPKRILARVVGVSKPFGAYKYQLRCNTGVLPDTYFQNQLRAAVPQRAAELQFEGVAVQGVRMTTEREARGGHVSCSCRRDGGKCGPTCPCRPSLCGRHCGCKHGKGANCGNCS